MPSPTIRAQNSLLTTGKPFRLAIMQGGGQLLRLAHNPMDADVRDDQSFFVYADTNSAHFLTFQAQREPSVKVARYVLKSVQAARNGAPAAAPRIWNRDQEIRHVKHVPAGWYVPHSHTHARVCVQVVVAVRS